MGGPIVRFNPDGSAMEIWADTGSRPNGLQFDAAGNLILTVLERSRGPQEAAVVVLQACDDVSLEVDGHLYLGSVVMDAVGRLPLPANPATIADAP